jgi:hypothetical protein
VKLPVEKAWGALEAIVKDSLSCPFWPNEFEVLRSEGLSPGNKLMIEGYGPFGITKKNYYLITEVVPSEKLVIKGVNATERHAESIIRLVPESGGKTKVSWSGKSYLDFFSPANLFYHVYFKRRFFAALHFGLNFLIQAA